MYESPRRVATTTKGPTAINVRDTTWRAWTWRRRGADKGPARPQRGARVSGAHGATGEAQARRDWRPAAPRTFASPELRSLAVRRRDFWSASRRDAHRGPIIPHDELSAVGAILEKTADVLRRPTLNKPYLGPGLPCPALLCSMLPGGERYGTEHSISRAFNRPAVPDNTPQYSSHYRRPSSDSSKPLLRIGAPLLLLQALSADAHGQRQPPAALACCRKSLHLPRQPYEAALVTRTQGDTEHYAS